MGPGRFRRRGTQPLAAGPLLELDARTVRCLHHLTSPGVQGVGGGAAQHHPSGGPLLREEEQHAVRLVCSGLLHPPSSAIILSDSAELPSTSVGCVDQRARPLGPPSASCAARRTTGRPRPEGAGVLATVPILHADSARSIWGRAKMARDDAAGTTSRPFPVCSRCVMVLPRPTIQKARLVRFRLRGCPPRILSICTALLPLYRTSVVSWSTSIGYFCTIRASRAVVKCGPVCGAAPCSLVTNSVTSARNAAVNCHRSSEPPGARARASPGRDCAWNVRRKLSLGHAA